MADNDEALKTIDSKVSEKERKLARLRRLAEQIPGVEADLAALRRARALISGEDQVERERDDVPAATRDERGTRQGSLGSLAVEIVKEAGRPMHVTEIAHAIRSRGKGATLATVVGAVARFARLGLLRRVGTSTYGIGSGGDSAQAEGHKIFHLR